MVQQGGGDAPYRAQDIQEVAKLVRSLEENSKRGSGGRRKGGISCRKATFEVAGANGGSIAVESWRFQDWDYKKHDLPTQARGLFTLRANAAAAAADGSSSSSSRPEIVVRGYDKFFNVGEVSATRWENVKQDTRGPYELTVKENGCIIFISGLPDGTLLVCSKHSTGVRQDTDVSHAVAGEKWVDRQLAAIGRTRADLAKELRQRNATAVAELCDDTFEEHILAYGPDRAGLYLHGINLNLPEFVTYPGDLLHRFADEWGFRKTEYLVKDDVDSVRTFLEAVGETGAWQGRDVEGFVIRCKARHTTAGPWGDWFFKYKYEEPYLMYRQWREVTRAIIAGKTPSIKKHKQITGEYIEYAREQLRLNPKLGAAFNQNHGIIAMRNGFLHKKGLTGEDVIRTAASEDSGPSAVARNVVLVPVATIGCGKTTVALALCRLFGWAHVQNDNIVGRKNRPQRFADEVCAALTQAKVVVADRNNHQKRERRQIIDDVQRAVRGARFVALHYVHSVAAPATVGGGGRRADDELRQRIRRVTRERVLTRGDNHQTIQAGSKSRDEITSIMDGFLHRFEPVDADAEPDDAFDSVIDLDVAASSRENLETVVAKLHMLYPKLFAEEEMPSASDLDAAIDAALTQYRPDIKHEVGSSKGGGSGSGNGNGGNGGKVSGHASSSSKKKSAAAAAAAPKVDYFCIALPTEPVLDAVRRAFANQAPAKARFFQQLQNSRRLQATFHVTLVHRAHAQAHPAEWKRYMDLLDEKKKEAMETAAAAAAAAPAVAAATSTSTPTPAAATAAGAGTREDGEQATNHQNQNRGGADANTHDGQQPQLDALALDTCQVELERVVWNGRVMCIVAKVPDAAGPAAAARLPLVNRVAHVTLGTAAPHIKPKESNELLDKWRERGADVVARIDELALDDVVVLNGTVRAVMQRP